MQTLKQHLISATCDAVVQKLHATSFLVQFDFQRLNLILNAQR